MRLLKLSCILILLACFQQPAKANGENPFFVQHYDNRNGLSNSSINHIFRDASNLLWVATWDGLNMYDGSIFHVFNYSKDNDFKSIGSNVIQQVAEDKRGNIWVTTIEGISRYEKKSGKFYNYFYNQYQRSRVSEQEYSLAVDRNGKVYCLSQKNRLSYYDEKADSFRLCPIPGQQSVINKFAFDENNRLCLLTSEGSLKIYEAGKQQFNAVKIFREQKAIVNFFMVNRQLFFVNDGDELFSLKPGSLSATKLLQLEHTPGALIYYKDHYLFARASKGYDVYDARFQPSDFLQQETQRMQDIKVTSWALGSEDILWYGTDGNGIIKMYPATKSFGTITTSENGIPYNKSVRAFCEADGNLWVGTKGSGIIHMPGFWNNATAAANNKTYITAPGDLDNNSVYALKKGSDDLIYIGTDGKGIGVYDIKTKRFNKWGSITGHNAFPEFGSVYAIKQDADQSLWLGTSGYGLVHLKINRDAAGKLSVAFLERFTYNNNNTGPANDIIYALADGNDDQLWVGCRYGGLSLLDKKTRLFKTFKAFTYEGSLSNNDVLSVFKDSRSRIWVGTSYGLNCINNADAANTAPLFRKLTTANGLPNNTIHAIEEDSAGHIWVSTNKGMAKVNQADQSISYYQQLDGLQSNEFCDGAVWKDMSGNLYYGGTYGFNHFLPQNIRRSTWQPNLLLSGISIGGKKLPENGYSVSDFSGSEPLDFSISRGENFFELDIKAVSFLNAEKCEYAYFLEGYDKAWHYAGTNGKIIYSNILPGNYSLKVKWSNGDGLWTKEMSLMSVAVRQYFWLTGWAWCFYALVLSGLVYILYRYRKNKMEIKHQLQVEHVLREKEEEIHQNRLGFFTNIAHELQTPLTLIMGSAERSLHKTGTRDQADNPYFLSLIHQQASRLTYLVHQLLEFRKVEAGYFKNEFSRLHISELLQNLAEPFIPLSEQNKMEYEINISPGIIGWVDKDKIEKIIFNLLSNAFKHSGKNEQVVFSAAQNTAGNQLEITVVNSGTRLPEGKLDRLFEKFYVVSPNKSDSDTFGTGIGLAFTRQLVNLMNGSISAKSENERISFNVCLPLHTDQPAELTLASGITTTDQPSYLYRTITAYAEPFNTVSAVENNKKAIIENLQDKQKKNILVVEDEPNIRFLLNDILKDDYIVYEAEDGRKALELMEKIIPDLVICDVMMPNMGGLELCNKMKNSPATCQVPFVMLSARGSEEHHMEGYESGADAYIAKPFHTANLKLRIRKLLEYRQKLVELFSNDRSTDQLTESDLAGSDKEFLMNLVKLIEENIGEAELSAVFLEKHFSMSKMQLYRKLKTLTGMTPGEFIKHLRLKEAAHLLSTTGLNVTEIFYRTGFNNQSYFFREFRKRYDCAPNEYRERRTMQGRLE